MAKILPFRPYRYSAIAGPLEQLVTQPYDKITPEMQKRYLALNPHNLVRLILGERYATDDETRNVYRRAAHDLIDWIFCGVLVKEDEPSLFAYFQEFQVPDSSERLVRKGFIGLGELQPYSAGIVHPHERTLSGPKKDRMELLRHTRAHFGQIFMLYSDAEQAVDRILDKVSSGAPLARVDDEYGATHTLWKISDPATIAQIQELMSDKKLLIADGHHRYETALAFRDLSDPSEDAKSVMMTFVNMHSPGLRILATHRVLSGLENFDRSALLQKIATKFVGSLEELKRIFASPAPDQVRIGIVLPGPEIRIYEADRKAGDLDVRVLHERLLADALGISEEAVREEKYIHYVRGLDAAFAEVNDGKAQVAFLLEPTTIQQVSDVAFSGGVMPQKSTDFYPKLLSGLTIYRLEN
ncbi:MAG: DUF1015 domain-containing protein [Acidobacteriaceae bacterium]|nr:DUF1015 domain-containing protein [Acidobacteriaceae bacterium]